MRDAKEILPPQLSAAVAAESAPFVQAIFDYTSPTMASKRIALLGDAAFVVRPHTAMGVSKAAGDALAIRDQFAKVADLTSALTTYDRERRAVGNEIEAYGRRLGASFD